MCGAGRTLVCPPGRELWPLGRGALSARGDSSTKGGDLFRHVQRCDNRRIPILVWLLRQRDFADELTAAELQARVAGGDEDVDRVVPKAFVGAIRHHERPVQLRNVNPCAKWNIGWRGALADARRNAGGGQALIAVSRDAKTPPKYRRLL